MSYIPGDREDDTALSDLLAEHRCELCGDECVLQGDNNYCSPCQDLVDAEETAELSQLALPILQPITVRPVELNAELWAEWAAEVVS